VHDEPVNEPDQPGRLSTAAMRAFEIIENADWSEGVPLADLLGRVNRVASQFLPDGNGGDSRVSRVFSSRSFRHYQTLGCIDAPERVGKEAAYGFRHFVQGLLVRRLLWERLPSERIVTLMAGRCTAETKRMLFEGIEISARPVGGKAVLTKAIEAGPFGIWKRIPVLTGIELHVRQDLPKPKPAELRRIIAALETALRKNL
jgi:hypothetical protein